MTGFQPPGLRFGITQREPQKQKLSFEERANRVFGEQPKERPLIREVGGVETVNTVRPLVRDVSGVETVATRPLVRDIVAPLPVQKFTQVSSLTANETIAVKKAVEVAKLSTCQNGDKIGCVILATIKGDNRSSLIYLGKGYSFEGAGGFRMDALTSAISNLLVNHGSSFVIKTIVISSNDSNIVGTLITNDVLSAQNLRDFTNSGSEKFRLICTDLDGVVKH